jgi:hypothetical protein
MPTKKNIVLIDHFFQLLQFEGDQMWNLLICCLVGITMLLLIIILLIFKLWKSNQLSLKDRKVFKSNSRWQSQEDQNVDHSSFKEESQAEHTNLNNSFEPVIVFTQNPYYDENCENDGNDGTDETRGVVAFSQNQECTASSSQNDPTIIFTSNPYYE